MNLCVHHGCKRERHPNPESEGRCGDCWREDEEHEEYQRNWYRYWNLRGRNLNPNIEPRMYSI